MWNIVFFMLIMLTIIAPQTLQVSIGQQNIESFEQRLNKQLASNNTNQTHSTQTTSLITNTSLLDMPRNSTLSQIQADNESITKLYNNSIQSIGVSSENTRQNVSDILSILK